MKKFIELTMMQGIKVHVNTDQIGYLFETQETTYKNGGENIDVTVVSVTTHGNGGLRVLETSQEILNLINAN
jgi:hypothetical protein